MDFLSFDQILSIPTLVEVLTIVIFFFIFPIFTITTIIEMIALYLYLNYVYKKKPTKLMKTTMKAALYIPSRSNSFFKMTNTSIPYIGPKDVLISVKNAAINPVDYKVNLSFFPFARFYVPLVIGRDVVGTVIEIGSSVTHFKEGDNVYGCAESGCLAEYAVCHEDKIAKVSETISPGDIAGCALASETAYQSILWFFKPEELKEKTILVIGGSGGVGSTGIQICNYYKAKKVCGVCSTKNITFVQSLTPYVIDYTKNLDEQIGNEKFDLIFDTVTSKDDPNQFLIFNKYLSPSGKYVQINGTPKEFLGGILTTRLFRNECFEKNNFHLHLLIWKREDLEVIEKMVAEQKLVIKYETLLFNYDEIKNGFDKLKSRRTVGKIVFQMPSNTIN